MEWVRNVLGGEIEVLEAGADIGPTSTHVIAQSINGPRVTVQYRKYKSETAWPRDTKRQP